MPALPQFDYIFAIATLFAFLDAWNIGMYQLSHDALLHLVFKSFCTRTSTSSLVLSSESDCGVLQPLTSSRRQ
jgi:hypothetical protein